MDMLLRTTVCCIASYFEFTVGKLMGGLMVNELKLP